MVVASFVSISVPIGRNANARASEGSTPRDGGFEERDGVMMSS
jgi:hypothetical protein